MSERHWRKSGPRMADLRADRRAVGLVETTVWVPEGRAAEIREWAWSWCEEHLSTHGLTERYENLRKGAQERDKER